MESWLAKKVKVKIDRPMGSKHHQYPTVYPINYGYVPGTFSEIDHEEIDAYILGPNKPLKRFEGFVKAVVFRTDGEIKLIVTDGWDYSIEEIERQINFQEKFHKHKIIK
jgi:inorganic pyrophosphatase